MSKQNTERLSIYVVSEFASEVTAKWMFSPGGGLAQTDEGEEEEDFSWEKQTTTPTVPVDFQDDSSIMHKDEFAEDLVEDVKELHHHAAVKNDDECVSLHPSPPSSPHEALLQRCHKEFKQLSCRQITRRASSFTTPMRMNNSVHHPRSSLGSRKRYMNQRLTLSERNRDLIWSSMRRLLDP